MHCVASRPTVDSRNTPSCKLLESLGFTREGFLRERWNINDEICDTVFYGVLARELGARRRIGRRR